jgi:tetratricopeptide (TPR) repeat protein
VVNVGAFMNERFVYQGSVAFAVGIVWILLTIIEKSAVKRVLNKNYLRALMFLVIILSYSIVTFSRNFVWKNDYTLFLTDVKTSSNSAKSNCGAGGVLLDEALKTKDPAKKREELTLAVQYLTKAINIDPTYSDVWRKLGTSQFELTGDINSSFQSFCSAIKHNPGDEASYANIHFLLSKCDDLDIKIQYYKELLKINPRRTDVNNKLGFLFGRYKHDVPSSIYYFQQSVNLNPNNKEAFKGLGAANLSIGKYDESLKWAGKALTLDSLDAGTYTIMGNAAMLLGDKQKADFFLSNASRLKSKKVEVE